MRELTTLTHFINMKTVSVKYFVSIEQGIKQCFSRWLTGLINEDNQWANERSINHSGIIPSLLKPDFLKWCSTNYFKEKTMSFMSEIQICALVWNY